MNPSFQPQPEHRFTFGLWTVGNIGRDPFGEPTRKPLSPVEIVHLLAEVGAYGVNFHDNDLVPIDATPAERDRIVKDFKQALADTGLVVPMATTNLFSHPVFKDGAFTSNDPDRARLCPAEDDAGDGPGRRAGREDLRLLGRPRGRGDRRGQGSAGGHHAQPRRDELPVRVRRRSGLRPAVCAGGQAQRAARRHLQRRPPGHMLAFIATLDHPEMVGVNPEVAHEHMAGLNFLHGVAQAWDAGKLFHIDLNDQAFGRYDQDFRFGAVNLKSAFFLVKFLEDVGYAGSATSTRTRTAARTWKVSRTSPAAACAPT